MNLKESYRYSNYLDTLLNNAYDYLNDKGFVTTTEQNHLRSKANPDATDEIVTLQKPYDVSFTPNDLLDFVVELLNEKEKLSNAIAVAKSNAEINIDTSVALNKKRYDFINVLKRLSNIRPNAKQSQGSDFRFNINNEQVRYCYTIENTTTIDYDRNDVRNLVKKYTKQNDEISSKLDAIEINTVVEIDPKFDVNESFEESIEEFMNKNNK